MSLYSSASAVLTGCSITHASATSHSSNAHGGCLYLTHTGTNVTLSGTALQQHCTARSSQGRGEGSAAFVADGALLQLTNGTAMLGCDATTGGRTMAVSSVTALYLLPAPPGRWIAGSTCLVNRRSCPLDQHNHLKDPTCPATHTLCRRVPTSITPLASRRLTRA